MRTRGTFGYGAALVAGAAAIAAGFRTPVYTNNEAASELKARACSANTPYSDGSRVIPDWYSQMEALETLRHPLMQSGISILLATATVWFLVQTFGGKVSALATPRKRWTFVLLGLFALGLSWVAEMHSFTLDQSRGAFPWCADTIIIPMFNMTLLYVYATLGCLIVAAFLMVGFGELPQSLWIWRTDKPRKSWIVTIVFGVIGLVLLVIGLDNAHRSAFMGTPAAIVVLFLVAATRAAILSENSAGGEKAQSGQRD